MKSRQISRSKIGPFSLACTDPYIGIGWEYQSKTNGNKSGNGTFRHQIISALRRFGTCKAFLVYYHIQKLVRVLQWLKH